jgi:glycosyltransferase involved in cell wall biosynthesis
MSRLDVAVIIPTLNEEGAILSTLRSVLATNVVSWVIIVDDSSTDHTVKIIQALQRFDPRIRLIARVGRRKSFARSYVEGFLYALDLGADVLIQMDGDGSHDASDIRKIIDALRTSDVAVCSRYAEGGENRMRSSLRHLLSYLGSRFSQTVLKMPVRDMTGGFNGWKARSIKTLELEENRFDGFGFQVWLKWKAYTRGYRLAEVPIVFRERGCGQSKFRFYMALEVLLGLIKMRLEISRPPSNIGGRSPKSSISFRDDAQ